MRGLRNECLPSGVVGGGGGVRSHRKHANLFINLINLMRMAGLEELETDACVAPQYDLRRIKNRHFQNLYCD